MAVIACHGAELELILVELGRNEQKYINERSGWRVSGERKTGSGRYE